MSRNVIEILAEGHGEAGPSIRGSEPAATVLVSRLLHHLGHSHELFATRTPLRMRSVGEFYRADVLEKRLRYLAQRDRCAAVLILLDMDDGCPTERARELGERVRAMLPLPFSTVIVAAKREYEAWFLASLESIHEGEAYPGDPESLRDAKGWLRKRYRYRPTSQQSEYTRRIDIKLAASRSRSFRRMLHAVDEIVTAYREGIQVVTPALGDSKDSLT